MSSLGGSQAYKKVVITDDHPYIRRLISENLKDVNGLRCVEAVDGLAGLIELGVSLSKPFPKDGSLPQDGDCLIEKRDISCLITDFNMPHVNGLNLLKMIRAGKTGVPRDLPVVVLTAHNEDRMVAAALELDVSGFVIKPVSKKVLTSRLLAALQGKGELKSPAEYMKVHVPMSESDQEEKEKQKSDIKELSLDINDVDTSDEADSSLPLVALQEGDVLGRDLVTMKGVVLLSAGTKLTASLIKRIREIYEITGLIKTSD